MNKDKIKKFIFDEIMASSVYKVIHDSFLKGGTNKDIHVLAAERIALDLLDDAWKELAKYKGEETAVLSPLKQVGL